MKTLIKKCAPCGVYTMKGFCPKCNEKTSGSAPPRFGPEDKYGDIRRKESLAEGDEPLAGGNETCADEDEDGGADCEECGECGGCG